MPRLRLTTGIGAAALGACLLLLLAAPAARAVDRIYWANGAVSPNNKISWANLDGSGGGDLNTTGATVGGATGLAIDPASGRIYWANSATASLGIFFANLSGGGGGSLSTAGATAGVFQGLAIRPAAPANPLARMYWTRISPDGISFARQDGMGDGGNFTSTGFSVVDDPRGVAIRPAAAAGRGVIYWVNTGTLQPGISTAVLDGSSGQPLLTSGATVDDPRGVAINEASGRAYWTNVDNAGPTNDGISFTNIDGSGMGGDLDITGASINNPTGVAIDPDAGRVYWLNTGAVNGVSFANLTGGGGGDLNVSGATASIAAFAALLKAPKGTGAPQIAGGTAVGSALSCTQGLWAANLYEAQLYREPASFAFQWSRDGADIPGATSSSLVATVAGLYQCRVAATNHAGTTSQTSATHNVSVAGAGTAPSNQFTLGKLLKNKKRGIAFLLVNVPGPGELGLSGKGVQGIGGAGIARKSLAVSRGQVKLKIRPAKKGRKARKLRRQLRDKGKAKLTVVVTFVPTGGLASSQRRKVKLIRK